MQPPELNLSPPFSVRQPLAEAEVALTYEDSPVIQDNYLSGGGVISESGLVLRERARVDRPGRNYFPQYRREAVMRVDWFWVDLSSFFWWWPLVETEDFELIPNPDYFPVAEQLVLTPTVIDAVQIPEAEYDE